MTKEQTVLIFKHVHKFFDTSYQEIGSMLSSIKSESSLVTSLYPLKSSKSDAVRLLKISQKGSYSFYLVLLRHSPLELFHHVRSPITLRPPCFEQAQDMCEGHIQMLWPAAWAAIAADWQNNQTQWRWSRGFWSPAVKSPLLIKSPQLRPLTSMRRDSVPLCPSKFLTRWNF